MDRVERARLQVRLVTTVFRAELARIERSDATPAQQSARRRRLRAESLRVLEAADKALDGEGALETRAAIAAEWEAARRQVDEAGGDTVAVSTAKSRQRPRHGKPIPSAG